MNSGLARGPVTSGPLKLPQMLEVTHPLDRHKRLRKEDAQRNEEPPGTRFDGRPI